MGVVAVLDVSRRTCLAPQRHCGLAKCQPGDASADSSVIRHFTDIQCLVGGDRHGDGIRSNHWAIRRGECDRRLARGECDAKPSVFPRDGPNLGSVGKRRNYLAANERPRRAAGIGRIGLHRTDWPSDQPTGDRCGGIAWEVGRTCTNQANQNDREHPSHVSLTLLGLGPFPTHSTGLRAFIGSADERHILGPVSRHRRGR
jgi:hypothetical protein